MRSAEFHDRKGPGYSRERCVFSIVFLSISARNASLTPRDSKYGPKSTKHIFAQSWLLFPDPTVPLLRTCFATQMLSCVVLLPQAPWAVRSPHISISGSWQWAQFSYIVDTVVAETFLKTNSIYTTIRNIQSHGPARIENILIVFNDLYMESGGSAVCSWKNCQHVPCT